MFNAFERKVAARYLRARRGERFVSVIAIFSLVGIALGVATLIIVMSVMNGFRQELLGQILGLNGDIGVYAAGAPLTDYDALAAKIRNIPGVTAAFPIVQGEVLLSGPQGGAVGDRVQTQVGVADRLLHGDYKALVPHVHGDHPGLWHANGADGIEGHRRAVGFHMDRLHQAHIGAAGAKA